MSRNNSRPVGAVATGLAIGLLVGAGAALFLAPLDGRGMRRKISRGVKRVGYRGQDAWDELRDELHRARRRVIRARRRRALSTEEPELGD